MKLIVGLGNDDRRYEITRHNAGFWVLDELATVYGAPPFERNSKLHAYITKVQTAIGPVILAKPTTYMNNSGDAVRDILHWYKLEFKDFLVIHDDVALPLGKIRIQSGGGAGGNHGIEDILAVFGGRKDFDRIKFGVGPDPGGDRRADYVLSPIPLQLESIKLKVIKLAVEAAQLWLTEGPKAAANKFNGLDLCPPPPPPPPQATPPEAMAPSQTTTPPPPPPELPPRPTESDA